MVNDSSSSSFCFLLCSLPLFICVDDHAPYTMNGQFGPYDAGTFSIQNSAFIPMKSDEEKLMEYVISIRMDKWYLILIEIQW